MYSNTSIQSKMYRSTLFFFTLVSLGLSRPEIGTIKGISINTHSRSPDARIIGGDLATDCEAHFVVYLDIFFPNNQTKSCSGTLITNQHVLTAANCVKGSEKIQVLLGSHAIEGFKYIEAIWSTKHIVHEKFNPMTFENNIAILKLQLYVDTDSKSTISKIQIPENAKGPKEYVGETGRIYGWGRVVDAPSSTAVKALRYVDVTVLPDFVCQAYYKFISENDICTSAWSERWRGHMVGACDGDNGGPLIINNKQIGIISFSNAKCEEGLPTVYTRIDKYLIWIYDAVENLGY